MATQFWSAGAPTPAQISQGLRLFCITAAAIVEARGAKRGMEWAGASARAMTPIAAQLSDFDVSEALSDFDEQDAVTLRTLLFELYYIAFKYRTALPVELQEALGELSEFFSEASASPLSAEAVDDIETVKGSVEKLLKKLPKWMQRIVEVLMELLKLTSGNVG